MTAPLKPYNPGDFAIWLCEPRGGWGYTFSIPAVVVGYGRARVKIVVQHRAGWLASRFVQLDHLRPFEGKAMDWMSQPLEWLKETAR